MSSHHRMSVTSPEKGPAFAVAALGIPSLVVIVLAVVFNWGR